MVEDIDVCIGTSAMHRQCRQHVLPQLLCDRVCSALI